ncbi:MAG: DUF4468 domain-containing protein [Prevotella sp.]|jgi:hypothetical protein|nr:DUF4468 domain-containing protein [Prevotella sp.]
MKKVLFFIVGIIPVILLAQENPFTDVFPITDGKVNYTEVIQVENKNASELYKNAKIWLVDAFKSSKDVIQNDDRDNFIVIGKGFFDGYGHNKSITNAKYWFTIRIDCRDNRYKYTITDFIYEFDVTVLGITTHYKEDFTKWGNVPFDTKFKELLDKKFPPNKERNAKQQQKYEQYKNELDNELAEKYIERIERYSLLDSQIKSIIDFLKKGIDKSDDNW